MLEKTYDLRIPLGTISMLCGPAGCGKTVKVAHILKNKNMLFKDGEKVDNVVFCYATWQPLYSELKELNIVTKWVNYLPTNEEFIDLVKDYKEEGSICIFDDFLNEINKDMVQICCVSSRHYNTASFFLFQNLFPKNPLAREISLNAKFIYVFRSPREKSQFSYLAYQILPKEYKWLIQVYNEVTAVPYGCLIIDLRQEAEDEIRFRSNILPHEYPTIVWKKSR